MKRVATSIKSKRNYQTRRLWKSIQSVSSLYLHDATKYQTFRLAEYRYHEFEFLHLRLKKQLRCQYSESRYCVSVILVDASFRLNIEQIVFGLDSTICPMPDAHSCFSAPYHGTKRYWS